ncbi:protein GrpE [Bombiscardovia nodaiensis]|uniref:Protein GrpE n=1 Tax=Bombiscardovia nodaiensis TaxID=2932181 RepID=A0ABM8B6F1_9BIFI|nr:protein GrpE [Bombiscardovia nodaiensis]
MASDMPDFSANDYLNGMSDAESLKGDPASAGKSGSQQPQQSQDSSQASDGQDESQTAQGAHEDGQAQNPAEGQAGQAAGATDSDDEPGAAGESRKADQAPADGDQLTPLGQAKKEAADYLEALQRERAQFVNYRNRTAKEQEIFRQHGIIDVLTALLPALDDIDRIREHGGLDDSFEAVAAKIDKTFEKFGVEKFGKKGEDFDPTEHEAILHKPDPQAHKETVDTVVEAGYRIGDRVIRAARVVVASPQEQ